MNKQEQPVQEVDMEQMRKDLITKFVQPLNKIMGSKWFTISEAYKKTQGQLPVDQLENVMRAMVMNRLAIAKKGGKSFKGAIIFKITPTYEMLLMEIDNDIAALKNQLAHRELEKQSIEEHIKQAEKIVGGAICEVVAV